ncbi:MAG: LacI family transcriptional regulator [Anaerolineae bacterium]|nr:MAG: LacI family transcriptional regulator [Anaerolineae bacterium]
MSVTIRDVAKHAGVGIATVSRVINGSPSVSEETRQRVLQAIEELNYTPNPIARRLSTGRTWTIGALVPFFTLPEFVKRLQGIQHALSESEYDLVLFNIENLAQRDRYFLDLTRNNRVDGLLILSLSLSDQQVATFREANIPVVLVDAAHPEVSRVVVNHRQGGRMATEHLISLGHQRIAFVSDPLEDPFHFTAPRQRYEGYREALEAAGLPFREEYALHGPHGRENARKMGRTLLSLEEPPTAVFAASDTQAIGVMEAAREMGLRVPDDLSVIGYGDLRDAEYLNLSTIHQPLFESGLEAVNLLLELIEDPPESPRVMELPIHLVERATTARK